MRTTLYEKVFIDGFHKPSYVVVTLCLAEAPDASSLEAAFTAVLERHPRLRSLVRTRMGIPIELLAQPADEWFARGGLRVLDSADLHALEETLLATPLDLRASMPVEVRLVKHPPALVARFHHAVIDGASGFALLAEVASHLGTSLVDRTIRGPLSRTPNGPAASARQIRDWVRRAQLRPRMPAPGLAAHYHPTSSLEREPVAYSERRLAGAFPRIVEAARRRGATFAELAASALLHAMRRYGAAQSARAPDPVGLMVARASRPRRAQAAGFRAETSVVNIPAGALDAAFDPTTLRAVRCSLRDRCHNDLALAALYVARKLHPPSRQPTEQRSLYVTMSDLTAFGRLPPGGAASILDVRVLASPTSFDHAGVLWSRWGNDLRVVAIAHRGAMDADDLLSLTLDALEET